MKSRYLAAAASLLLLTACGEVNTGTVDQIAAQQSADAGSLPDTPAPDGAAPETASDGEYDIDLTEMNSNMIYAQVYDMLNESENYTGKTVRVQGTFNYYQNPDTGREYFAALVSDATACCAQGIEFVLPGDVHYPEDYPEQGTPIEIAGTCNVYLEDDQPFVELLNATMKVL